MPTPKKCTPAKSGIDWRSWEPWALIVIVVAIIAVIVTLVVTTSDEGNNLSSPEAQINPSRFDADSYGLARRDDNTLAIGDKDAPVVLIDYSDMRCPYCAKWINEIEPELVKNYVETGKLRIEFRNVVLFGEQSQLGARAVLAAAKQGKGYEMMEEIFKHMPTDDRGTITSDRIEKWAKNVGIRDLRSFMAVIQTDLYDDELAADKAEANQLSLQSVPAFLINGYPIVGAQPKQTFIDVIESALLAIS
ncbi:MAG: thioredoxin domain-containing protein [Lawsonella sp.]|nr:thioredoxin domain-containing protein [Mycobacteriales bacterium]